MTADDEESGSSSFDFSGLNLSAEVLKHQPTVEKYAKEYGISDYVNYLLAIMQVESGGTGTTDVMQASESLGLPLNSLSVEDSIKQGCKYFSELLKSAEAKGCDINTVVQSYNYGGGFIDYVSSHGKKYTFSTTFLTSLVSTYSISAIAAYGITGKLETILFYPAMAFNMVLTSIVGQCIGAKRVDRAKDYLKLSLKYGITVLFILSILIIIFSKQLAGLFVSSDPVAQIVEEYFIIISIGYVLNTVTNCYLGCLNGMGKPTKSMILMIFYYLVVRIPLAYVFSYIGLGLNGIWIAVLISHIIACITAILTGTHSFKKNIKMEG